MRGRAKQSKAMAKQSKAKQSKAKAKQCEAKQSKAKQQHYEVAQAARARNSARLLGCPSRPSKKFRKIIGLPRPSKQDIQKDYWVAQAVQARNSEKSRQ